jgi:CO dehydrogenase maturation factor
VRVAFVGKGGAGKSAVAGTFARAVARGGEEVLAIDSDPMPGLAYSLGVPDEEAPLPDDLVVEKAEGEEGPRFRLRPDLTVEEILEQHAPVGPDGVRYLQFGKLRGHVSATMRSQFAFRLLTAGLPPDRWSLVGDLPGGSRQPAFGWANYADTFLVVVEPTAKSMLASRRIIKVLKAKKDGVEGILAIANKVADDTDESRIAARLGIEVAAVLPLDPAILSAESAGEAPIDHAPDAPSVRAVVDLAERMAELPDRVASTERGSG